MNWISLKFSHLYVLVPAGPEGPLQPSAGARRRGAVPTPISHFLTSISKWPPRISVTSVFRRIQSRGLSPQPPAYSQITFTATASDCHMSPCTYLSSKYKEFSCLPDPFSEKEHRFWNIRFHAKSSIGDSWQRQNVSAHWQLFVCLFVC